MMRTLTALLSIAAGIAIGALWFVCAQTIEPFYPVDVRFYFSLYTEIGAASGFFSWYIAMLVKDEHIRLRRGCFVLAIPFFPVLLLSLDLNPATALAVIVLFVLAVIPSCVIARSSHS
ncbi:MAG: hypothetical protein WBL72_00240 [Thermoguttaceae bacterium]